MAFSALAAAVAAAAIAWTVFAHPANMALRIVACVLLIDQATLTLLYMRLPVEVRPLAIALRIGAVLVMAAGALVMVWCSMAHAGPAEIAMPLVAVLMITHGAFTLRALGTAPRGEST